MDESILDRKPKPGFSFVYMFILLGKIYIGKAEHTLRERMKDGLGYFYNMDFCEKQVAFIKAGFESIKSTIQILAEVPLYLLNDTEAEFIDKYHAVEDGYNLINGSHYIGYKINSKNRTLLDNLPQPYFDEVILQVNPQKYIGHNARVDKTVYDIILVPVNPYILECNPDDEQKGHFGIGLWYTDKDGKKVHITLGKLITAYIFDLDPTSNDVPRVRLKNGKRDFKLVSMYIGNKSLYEIAKERGKTELLA